ncbi:MAG TPA: MraY family glycosyltransferase [Bacteroidia bacterium]|jgi:UDP-GlcNAc:undecaprenyl-phosphate GlcNAc-1-phosphate transferase|nr:MraY family glycosyltransferase [Bacteroidia bacterium]
MNFFSNIPLLYTLLFCGTLTFSILINGLFLNFSQNLGIRRNQEVQIRWSESAKPALGGISFYIVFLISFIFLELLSEGSHGYLSSKKIIGLLFSVTLAFLMGLADDAFDTKPLIKFMVQCFCGVILISTGTKINTFESEFLNYSLTLLWVVGVMNSINMLDNMDGISTIVSLAICAFTLYINMYFKMATSPISLITLTVIGTLCGFLIYNWHPSKVFMGDTGSQFLGIFLAFCSIDSCWNLPVIEVTNFPVMHPFYNIVIVGLVFIMPLTDTLIVVINRLLKGNSPFIGGRDHTTHFMFFNGLTEKRIAIIFLLINGIGGFLAFLLITRFSYSTETCLMFAAYPALLFFYLFYITLRKKQ